MNQYIFTSEQVLPRPRNEVFSYFGDATNLEALTPDHLQFDVVSDTPIKMREGTEIEYHLTLHGIPVTWISRIDVWEPPERFVDVQVKGPYRSWHHEHLFNEQEDGTLVTDRVTYSVPGWVFAPLIHYFFVRPDVESIFAYRRKRLAERFSKDEE